MRKRSPLGLLSASAKSPLFRDARKYHGARRKKVSLVLPLLAAAGLMSLSLLFSQSLSEREHSHIRAMTAAALEHVQSQIASEIEGRMQAMERISEHWALSGMPTKNSWDEEARLYIRHYPGIQAVTWTDPSFQTRWAVPFEHNQYLLTLESNSQLAEAFERSRDRKRSFIADAIPLPRGGLGFAIYAPITVTRSGEFHGFTGGLFRGEKLFEIILANVATDYSLKLMDSSGQTLFTRNRDGKTEPFSESVEAPLELHGLRWKIKIWPSQSLIKTSLSDLPIFVLAGGFLLAALLGGIIYLLQQTRLRAFRIARINLALNRQMKRRQHAEAALRETSARLRLALNSSGMGTWRLDLIEDVMSWDEALFKLFGLSPGTFRGGYEDFLNCIHADDREALRSSMARAVETCAEYTARYRVLLPDHTESTLESRGSVHCDDTGRPVHLSGVTWDVTAQKKREEIERYTEVLKRSNEELERFAYVASHDLKSPLNNIVYYTEELLKSASEKTAVSTPQIIERVHLAAVRMSALIDGLLEFSRVETEIQKMEPVALETIFQEILIDLESHIRRHGGCVETGGLPSVTGDRLQLRQLFQNLIANALKFHAPGKTTKVTVRAERRNDGFVEIRIQDDGIGIEKEYLDAIFKPFNRLHRQDEYEGSGIGLATCQRIIQRHHGTIEVESELGRGSIFRIRLPEENSPVLSHKTAA